MSGDEREKHMGINEISDYTSPSLERHFATIGKASILYPIQLCDSPAELELLAALVAAGDRPVREHDQHTVQTFVMQYPIRSYRVDFGYPAVRLAVEVDGYRWHDRTPELAERDKLRDRTLADCGWQTIRFAAREVFRDSCRCACEVSNHVARRIVELESSEHAPDMSMLGASLKGGR